MLATTASSDVVNLFGGVGWVASCFIFDFPGENLSPVHWSGGDDGFNIFVESSL
jgi:hypothetical protein